MYEYLNDNKLSQLFYEKNNYKQSNIINPFFKPKNGKNIENRKKKKGNSFELKKETKLKKIPYIYELNNIFYNAHFTDLHCTFKKSKKKPIRRRILLWNNNNIFKKIHF